MDAISKTVEVDETECTVICTPQGGQLDVAKNDKAKWKCKTRQFDFKLDFRIKLIPGQPTPTVPWPFRTNPPPAPGTNNSTGWITRSSFTGRFEEVGAFEYDLSVPCEGGLAILDPMIIVRP